jgi:hypothetical protein
MYGLNRRDESIGLLEADPVAQAMMIYLSS